MSHRDEIARLTPGLRRFAHALALREPCRTNEPADELVQKTIAAALRTGRHPTADALRIWLYGTFVNLFHARMREESRPMSGSPAPAARSQGVTQSLLELAVEDREALLLVVLEGFTYGQCAEILGVSRAAVVCRIARARQVLGQHLGVALPFEARRQLRQPAHLRLVK